MGRDREKSQHATRYKINRPEIKGPKIEEQELRRQMDTQIRWERENGYEVLRKENPPEHAVHVLDGMTDYRYTRYAHGEATENSFEYRIEYPNNGHGPAAIESTEVRIYRLTHQGERGLLVKRPHLKTVDITAEEFVEEYEAKLAKVVIREEPRRKSLLRANDRLNTLRENLS